MVSKPPVMLMVPVPPSLPMRKFLDAAKDPPEMFKVPMPPLLPTWMLSVAKPGPWETITAPDSRFIVPIHPLSLAMNRPPEMFTPPVVLMLMDPLRLEPQDAI